MEYAVHIEFGLQKSLVKETSWLRDKLLDFTAGKVVESSQCSVSDQDEGQNVVHLYNITEAEYAEHVGVDIYRKGARG